MTKIKLHRKHHPKLRFTFILATFVLLCVIIILAVIFTLFKIFLHSDPFVFFPADIKNKTYLLVSLIIACTIIGYGLSFLFSRIMLKPIGILIESLHSLTDGNYKQRLNFSKTLLRFKLFKELSDSFNKLASELEHTDTLSSDFINNYSHEFKTPIASIAGFAKLLKKDSLTREEQIDYLNIIEEESLRLSTMSTNALKLVKLENQTFLKELKTFNLSEQIRNCFLLLEEKWSKKNLNLDLDFKEYYIYANEELLKEVWINLIDNAVKFTPENGTISVEIKNKNNSTFVSVINTGSEISPEDQKHIFTKFYQADKSHSSQGSGIGLAIVKKIISLHSGTINVLSGNNKTIFIASIPD